MEGRILWSWSRRRAFVRWRSDAELEEFCDLTGISLTALASALRELGELKSDFFEVTVRCSDTCVIVEGTVASETVRRRVVDILRQCVDSARRRRLVLEQDPEKWKPVFRKDHAQTKR